MPTTDVCQTPPDEAQRRRRAFQNDVLIGLGRSQKSIPSKYLYDRRGSELFDRICELDEYYPTRTELAIMRQHADEMARAVGPRAMLIEYGSGSSLKTRLLLDRLDDPAAYVPVDISKEHLLRAVEKLRREYPRLRILPICADFTRRIELPDCPGPVRARIVYFPGSTIGNLTPDQAADLLRGVAALTQGGGLLIGVDLKKDPDLLRRAYNDSQGLTAAFNLNLLEHINRELRADFPVDRFEHRAIYNPRFGRVEMHLVSRVAQTVALNGETFSFRRGETIHTENSHKFSLAEFEQVARTAGLRVRKVWLDDRRLFSVQYLTAGDGSETGLPGHCGTP
ncbi:MAG: L-histidine N(alpha)-methyltransferase [Phycisphaerae bacterium]